MIQFSFKKINEAEEERNHAFNLCSSSKSIPVHAEGMTLVFRSVSPSNAEVYSLFLTSQEKGNVVIASKLKVL